MERRPLGELAESEGRVYGRWSPGTPCLRLRNRQTPAGEQEGSHAPAGLQQETPPPPVHSVEMVEAPHIQAPRPQPGPPLQAGLQSELPPVLISLDLSFTMSPPRRRLLQQPSDTTPKSHGEDGAGHGLGSPRATQHGDAVQKQERVSLPKACFPDNAGDVITQ